MLYYSKLYFTTENFPTWNVFFSTKFQPIKIPFSIWKLIIFFFIFDIDLYARIWIEHL